MLRAGDRAEFLPGSPPYLAGLCAGVVVAPDRPLADAARQLAARMAAALGRPAGELLERFRRLAGWRGAWERHRSGLGT